MKPGITFIFLYGIIIWRNHLTRTWILSLLFLCLFIFCGFQYLSSFILSFLPFQLTSSLLCLHTFIVKTVLVCFFPFPAFCLLCHEVAVQAPFLPLTTTASYCVFFTRTTEMVALREMCNFISMCLSYVALNTATFQVRCLTDFSKESWLVDSATQSVSLLNSKKSTRYSNSVFSF